MTSVRLIEDVLCEKKDLKFDSGFNGTNVEKPVQEKYPLSFSSLSVLLLEHFRVPDEEFPSDDLSSLVRNIWPLYHPSLLDGWRQTWFLCELQSQSEGPFGSWLPV